MTDQDLGFGTNYEKMILKRLAKGWVKRYRLRTARVFPANKLLGSGKVFDLPTGRKCADLVWNFCEFEQSADPEQFLSRVGRQTNQYLLIITQNWANPGVLIHYLYHRLLGKEWDHGRPRLMSGRAVLRAVRRVGGWQLVERGAFDLPWFVLDVYEMGRFLRRLPVGRKKLEKIVPSRWEEGPAWLKRWLAHHHYLLFKKVTR